MLTIVGYPGKRAFDLAIALPFFLASLPVQLAVGLAISINLGRPIFFRQLRPGLGEKQFKLIKFRTMLPVDHTTGRVENADRHTPFGRFLRSTSLDELPTLWNVIRGDMSIVGPRPLLPAYLSLYSESQSRRHEVRPGITGLAQSHGRNDLDWQKKFELDVEYVDNCSLRLDLKIIFRTAYQVLARRGIDAPGGRTVQPFKGDKNSGTDE